MISDALGTGTMFPDFSILTAVNAVLFLPGSLIRKRFSAKLLCVICLLVPEEETSFALRLFA